jgi:hypothetical protein
LLHACYEKSRSNLHDHMTNIISSVPNQSPFVDILHNRPAFAGLYFDLLPEDEDLSVSYRI